MPIIRHPSNPVLSAKDIPYPADLIFNAGVCKYQGRYIMAFRNDYGYGEKAPGRFTGTNIGLAFSDDGIRWTPEPKPWIEWKDSEIFRAYDPRITIVDGKIILCFAVDTAHGVRGGIATTEDFDRWEVLSLSVPDNRNMVVFPEKIDGRYCRLERPFPVYSRGGRDRFDIWFSDSPGLRYWGNEQLVLGVEDVPYANDKIGPAAPPVKTPKGWLTTFHAVDKDDSRGKNGWEATWKKRYHAGIMLLDLEQPWKVIGLYQEPLLTPETPYETDEGFRTNVIFPGGMILEDSGEVKIYYGAADTVECLATAHVDDLIALCKPYSRA
ncbi:MAG: glycoside hydrolase family 130 protein [Kiritimatiellia bacterium]|jgi:beta-1,4-mannooligosaccharide/beta-1,4-mannosyl-N-acetylglucosamine phosphorylase